MACQDGQRPGLVPLSPHPVLPQHYSDAADRHAYVLRLFNTSARHYDWLNRVMSLGTGYLYRRHALLRAGLAAGMDVLDVGCGTGVLAKHAAHIIGPQGCVIAMDPSTGMLRQAIRRGVRHAVLGIGESLPFAAARFDMLTMGYALRHVTDLRATFAEYQRVLKPGGKLLLLEITPSTFTPLRHLMKLYLKFVIPALAGTLRRSHDARQLMVYFWDTVEYCVPPEMIMVALRDVGLEHVRRHVSGGMLSEYIAVKA